MPERYTYRHSGLLVSSELELPEWQHFASKPACADVHIVLSDKPCPDCPTDGSSVHGDTLRFAIEGIGGWQVSGGHSISLHPIEGTAPAELRLFTLGSAWGALGYQRGFAMWHGSAVTFAGRTVLFCGDTGAGKSTMAAAMIADGAKLVADDLSRIEPDGSGALIHPSSSRVKLWREAIEQFGWQDRILQRDFFRDDKFHCEIADSCANEGPLALDAVIILKDAQGIELERVSGVDALGAVTRATLYRPEMLDAMGLWGVQGGLAAQILEHVPAYVLRRPKSFSALKPDGDVIEKVQTCLSQH